MVDMEEERRKWRERTGRPVVEPGPAGGIVGAEQARQAEPYVRQVRERVFGSPDPPWDRTDDPGAVAWNAKQLRRSMRGRKPTEKEALLYAAIETLSEVTGFDPLDVRTWIATGERPSLHRALVQVTDETRSLPDGTEVRRRQASLVLNARITEREIRRIWREHLRPVWDAPSVADASDPGGHRFSDLDYHLEKLVERMPEASWRERLSEWKQTPPVGVTMEEWRKHGDVTENALRLRWHRLNKKKKSIQKDED